MGSGLGSRFGSLVIVLIFVSLWAAFLENKESRTAIGRSRVVGNLSIGQSQAHLSELVVSGFKGEIDSLEEAITPDKNLRRDFNPFEIRDDNDIWYVGVRSVPFMRPLITSKGQGIAVGHKYESFLEGKRNQSRYSTIQQLEVRIACEMTCKLADLFAARWLERKRILGRTL